MLFMWCCKLTSQETIVDCYQRLNRSFINGALINQTGAESLATLNEGEGELPQPTVSQRVLTLT